MSRFFPNRELTQRNLQPPQIAGAEGSQAVAQSAANTAIEGMMSTNRNRSQQLMQQREIAAQKDIMGKQMMFQALENFSTRLDKNYWAKKQRQWQIEDRDFQKGREDLKAGLDADMGEIDALIGADPIGASGAYPYFSSLHDEIVTGYDALGSLLSGMQIDARAEESRTYLEILLKNSPGVQNPQEVLDFLSGKATGGGSANGSLGPTQGGTPSPSSQPAGGTNRYQGLDKEVGNMLGPSTLPPSKTALAMSRGISSTQPVNYDQDVQALIQGAPIEVAVQGALDGGFLGMTNAIKRSPGGPQVAAMLDPFVATYTNAPRTPDEIRVPREIAGASYRYFSEVRDILEAGLDSGAYADETTRAQAQSAIGGLNQLLTNYHRGAGQGRGEASDRLAVWAMSAGVPEALQSDPIAAGRFLSDRIHAQVAEFKRAKETLTKIAPQDAKLYRQQIQLRRRIFKARLKGDTATADQLVQQMYDLSDQRQALHSPLAGGQAPASPSANFAPSNRPEPGSVEAGNEQFRGMSPGGTSHIDYENYDEFLLGMKPPMED